jgi:glycine oxidase
MSDRTPDVLIVGAGVIGLCAAWELHRRGLHSLVCDAGEPGAASWAGGGILAALPPWQCPPALQPLLDESLRRYPPLCAELREAGGCDPEFWTCGALVLGPKSEGPSSDWGSANAAEHLAAEVCRQRIPGVGGGEGAWWLPHMSQVRSPRLLRAMAGALEQEGVEIRRHSRVDSLVIERGRIVGVRIGDGTVSAGAVLIAAGAWSSRLWPRLQLRPVKGQMLLYETEPGALPHLLIGAEHYLIPRRDGRILVGSTLEESGFDNSPTANAREALVRAATALWEPLAKLAPVAHWAGLRPARPDALPVADANPEVAGLYACSGHFRMGLALAPAAAQHIAAAIAAR